MTQKKGRLIAICSIFFVGMAYLRWNPHVQKIQNVYGKGGQRVSKAELQTAKVDPYFERKKDTFGGVPKSLQGLNFDFRAQSSWEIFF